MQSSFVYHLLLQPGSPLIARFEFVGTCTDLAYDETAAVVELENVAIDIGIGDVGLNPLFALAMLPVFPTITFDEMVGICGI